MDLDVHLIIYNAVTALLLLSF